MAADSDFLTPDGIENAVFETKRRGYDQEEVRNHLTATAATVTALEAQITDLTAQIAELNNDVKEAELTAKQAAQDPLDLSDEALAKRVSREAAHTLADARASAADRIAEAEERAAEIIAEAEKVYAARSKEADEEASRIRRKAGLDAEQRAREASSTAAEIVATATADIEHARSLVSLDRESADVEASRLVREAETARRQILEDLARRRSAARRQIEQLRAGRERLLASHETVRRALDEITQELSISMSEARAAAETAGHSVQDTTIEELEAEIELARLSGLIGSEAPKSPALPKPAAAIEKAEESTDEVEEDIVEEAVAQDEAVEEETADEDVAEEVADVEPEVVAETEDSVGDAADLDNVVDIESARPEVATDSHPANGRDASKAAAAKKEDSASEAFASLRSTGDGDPESESSQAAPAKAKKNPPSKRKPKTKGGLHTSPAAGVDEVAAAGLARRLKRVLADEQSRAMSKLKSSDEIPELDVLLRSKADHRDTYWSEVLDQTDDASTLPDDAGDAVDELVDMIRSQVGAALEDADSDVDVAVSSLRNIYRDIKTKKIVPAAGVICRKNLATT